MTQHHNLFRLADHTVLEPLTNSWPAWWCTVAPLPSSFHAMRFQIPLLESFLREPKLHVEGSANESLYGHPHVELPIDTLAAVQQLLQKTKHAQSDALVLADDIEGFQARLLEQARGQSVERFYADLPLSMRGLVELVYDYSNRISLRFMEGALYDSRYYKPQLQSLRIFPLRSDKSRPFFMMTPSLWEANQIAKDLQFADPDVDELARLDLRPQPLARIEALIGSELDAAKVAALLTQDPVRTTPRWEGQKLRIRYVGHACVLVERAGCAILIDPLVPVQPLEGGSPRITFQDLPAVLDYVLITHNHYDHFALETLLRLRHRIQCLVVPKNAGLLFGDISLKLMAKKLGFKNVVDLDTHESISLPDGEILATPFLGEHGDLGHSKATYIVRFGHEKILFAADSACVDPDIYRHLRNHVGPVDHVFANTEIDGEGALVSFGLESMFPKQRNRKLERTRLCRGSNAAETLQILEILGAQRFYNYAMGLEPWMVWILGPSCQPDSLRMKEADRLMSEATARGVRCERLNGSRELGD